MASPPQRLESQSLGSLSLNKYFFFPGFTARTGGLLCERGLIVERERWQQDEAELNAYWASLGLPPNRSSSCGSASLPTRAPP